LVREDNWKKRGRNREKFVPTKVKNLCLQSGIGTSIRKRGKERQTGGKRKRRKN